MNAETVLRVLGGIQSDAEPQPLDIAEVSLPLASHRLSAPVLAAQAAARSSTWVTGTLELSAPQAGEDAPGSSLEFFASPAVASGLALSATLLFWVTRAGGLLVAMVASVPAWRGLDPLPILERSQDSDGERDDAQRQARAGSSPPLADPPNPDAGTLARPSRVAAAATRELLEPLETL